MAHRPIIYKIKLTNWQKYNKNVRKSYRSVMINERFLDDAKIRTLPPCARLMFLSCILAASGSTTGEVAVSTDTILSQCAVKPSQASRYFQWFEQLQLLSYEIITPLINRIEVKRSEVKGIEIPATLKISKTKPPKPEKNLEQTSFAPQPKVVSPAKSSLVWLAYCAAYQQRYKIQPADNKTIRSQMCRLVDLVGSEEAVEIVKFYLTHNDSFYLKTTHQFGNCLRDANSLRTQWLKGKTITQTDIRRFEKTQETASLLNSIEQDGI